MEAQLRHTHDQEHHAQPVNESPAVRSGLVQPTDMGNPVLVEDLYTTHSDIVDPPVRSFAQWEEEEERRGAPPPLSTGIYGTDMSHVGHYRPEQYVNRGSIGVVEDPFQSPPSTGIYFTHPSQVGHHSSGQDVLIGESTGMLEDPYTPNSTATVSPAPNYQTKVTDPTKTGGKEAGITEVLRSFDKMGVYDEEPHPRSDKNEPTVYTGSHDEFAPEPVENAPLNTNGQSENTAVAGDSSSSYSQKITSAASAIANKAVAAKDMIASKLGENKSEEPPKPSFHSDYAHKVADTMAGTLCPVYEKVVEAGNTVMSKMPERKGKGVSVKEYLADSLRPGDEDRAMSEAITHALQRGKGETTTTTTTTIYVRDDGERRLQESGN